MSTTDITTAGPSRRLDLLGRQDCRYRPLRGKETVGNLAMTESKFQRAEAAIYRTDLATLSAWKRGRYRRAAATRRQSGCQQPTRRIAPGYGRQTRTH